MNIVLQRTYELSFYETLCGFNVRNGIKIDLALKLRQIVLVPPPYTLPPKKSLAGLKPVICLKLCISYLHLLPAAIQPSHPGLICGVVTAATFLFR